MNKIEIKSVLTVYEDVSELPEDIQQLMNIAVNARKKAYAPYSKFRVGAALSLENGEVVIGNNQENASYPSGLCAERVAIYQAGAKYPDLKIKSLAISASSDIKETLTPIPPCGACRQSISEYEIKQGEPISIYFMGKTGRIIKADSLKDLLPLTFDKDQLI
ncbi:cytidine deaminase [Abyssalbus ytuae]|uniref:Cytidine deaminase n=1 Tax=Abyssalbus ytuae TaxID=2926907 RepID=A0A9E6ZQ53_9FLAO|nr:cytidine deaminase [Abyssalbus ytuae]UOB18525.1 cytidine deaminase [Abyssalbus ytuae]